MTKKTASSEEPMYHTCARCGQQMRSYSTSFFNTDVICSLCKCEEKEFPGYANARSAEERQTRAGNRNFAGVGLSATDYDAMHKAIAARTAAE